MSVLLKKDVPYAKRRKTNQPRRLQPTTFFFSGFRGCEGGGVIDDISATTV